MRDGSSVVSKSTAIDPRSSAADWLGARSLLLSTEGNQMLATLTNSTRLRRTEESSDRIPIGFNQVLQRRRTPERGRFQR